MNTDRHIRNKASAWRVLHDSGLNDTQRVEFQLWLDADVRHAMYYGDISATWDSLTNLKGLNLETNDNIHPTKISKKRNLIILLCSASAMAAAFLFIINITSKPEFITVNDADVFKSKTPNEKQLLPDGSIVQLNIDATVEIEFTESHRLVKLLNGEAHFNVFRDKKRPFIVNINNVNVIAIGTVFNVNMTDENIQVIVTEGKVRVDNVITGKSVMPIAIIPEKILHAGQRLVLNTKNSELEPHIYNLNNSDRERLLSWCEPRLIFTNLPLQEIAMEFNKHNSHQIVIINKSLAEKRLGGNFSPYAFDKFINLLEKDFGVHVEVHDGYTVLSEKL